MVLTRRRGPRASVVAMALVAIVTVVVVVVVGTGEPSGAGARLTLTGGQLAASYGAAAQPSVSSNGSQMLVVWTEVVGGSTGVYGVIASADTTSIGNPFTIEHIIGKDATAPDVAWDGTRWLVAWQQVYSSTDHDIYGRTVTPSGVVEAQVFIATQSSDQRNPSVAAGPGEFLVSYEQGQVSDPTGVDVWSRSVGGLGQLPSRAVRGSFDGTSDPSNDGNPDVVYNSHFETYITVWDAQSAEQSQIEARGTGQVFGPSTLVTQASHSPVAAPTIADGEEDGYLIAFENQTLDTRGSDIWGVQLFAPQQPPFPISSQPGDERDPTITFNGTYLVAWRDRRKHAGGDLYGARLSNQTRPAVVDKQGFLITEYAATNAHPALTTGTTTANTFGLVWEATPAGRGTGIPAYGMKVASK